MKADDLYNGITGIRDDQVMEAVDAKKRERKRRRLPWAVATAAVLAIVLVALLVSGPMGTTGYALAEPTYPKTVSYGDGQEQYEKWRAQADQRSAAAEGLEHATDQFQAALLPQLLQGDGENRVCSPLNIYIALSMLAETTGGNSRDQVLSQLGCGDMETLRDQANRLWTANWLDDGVTTSRLANSIWLADGRTYAKSTVDTLADRYYAASYQGEMGSDGYTKALQDWLNENTGHLLEKEAGGIQTTPETIMTLASTIYFRAGWKDEFYAPSNTQETFHAPDGDETVEMMHYSDIQTYYRGTHFGAITRSFRNGGCMVFVLPDEGYTPEDLLAEGEVLTFLNQRQYEDWAAGTRYDVHLSLPKFDVSSNLNLLDTLQAMGITDILQPGLADFSPLLPDDADAALSSATHAARVKVDEEGVEAAAYTVLSTEDTAVEPPERLDFVLDRPFLFTVSGATGSMLFAGVVNHP